MLLKATRPFCGLRSWNETTPRRGSGMRLAKQQPSPQGTYLQEVSSLNCPVYLVHYAHIQFQHCTTLSKQLVSQQL